MASNVVDPDQLNASSSNFRVDYVIKFSVVHTTKDQAEVQFVKLVKVLRNAGLMTEARYGNACYIFIFVKAASELKLKKQIYLSRLQEWLHDIHNTFSLQNMQKSFQEKPITEAERLRFIHWLITSPKTQRGVGITPRSGQWSCVETIFPLHNRSFNQDWVKRLNSKYFLSARDLFEIKDHFGEKTGFYFAFLQSYFLFLIIPAVLGLCAWLILGNYSPVYAIFNCLWCIIFVEYWKKQERQLADLWESNNVEQIWSQKTEFQYENTISDPITGEVIQIYSPLKRLLRQLLQIPFALGAALALGGLIATCFAIEIFISEVYNGPFKSYLLLLPTIILTTLIPPISTILTRFASKLTDIEKYKTRDSHETSMIQKLFVLNFITSYLPIFLTAFVYVPFGQVLVPYLDFLHLIVELFAKTDNQTASQVTEFRTNPKRLKSQVIYFTVTAQLTNFALEVLMPFTKRKIFSKLKSIRVIRTNKRDGINTNIPDNPKELEFLTRVRNEAEMEAYDVTSDFREIVVQFGYLSLFSTVWPLTAISFLINNWIEIRGDALKIAMETQRTIPWRVHSIGPWIDALGFLTWLGSLTSAALVYLFYGDGLDQNGMPWDVKGWGFLLSIFFAEHFYMVARFAVTKLFSNLESSEVQKERSKRLKLRENYLKEFIIKEADDVELDEATCKELGFQDFSRKCDAIFGNLEYTQGDEYDFWQSQRDLTEIIEIGKDYIHRMTSSETKKEM